MKEHVTWCSFSTTIKVHCAVIMLISYIVFRMLNTFSYRSVLVHLSVDVRRRAGDDGGLPLPAKAAHRLHQEGQQWRLPGQPRRSLGSGSGDRAGAETGNTSHEQHTHIFLLVKTCCRGNSRSPWGNAQNAHESRKYFTEMDYRLMFSQCIRTHTDVLTAILYKRNRGLPTACPLSFNAR